MSGNGRSWEHRRVDTPAEFQSVLCANKLAPAIAVDCEGVDLSRSGPLTVLTIKPLVSNIVGNSNSQTVEEPALVIDALALGGDLVFGGELREILESEAVIKYMFDCRSDSDALSHQFQVKLAGVIDCQVWHQGVRIHGGEMAPRTNSRGFVSFVKGLTTVAQMYLSRAEMDALRGCVPPHKEDFSVWEKRPLSNDAWGYAAADVHLIVLLVHSFTSRNIEASLFERVKVHSRRYVSAFRDRLTEVQRSRDKFFMMTDVSIFTQWP